MGVSSAIELLSGVNTITLLKNKVLGELTEFWETLFVYYFSSIFYKFSWVVVVWTLGFGQLNMSS